MGVGEWVVVGLCLVLGLGYLWGANTNRSLAETALRWLRPGLRRLGDSPRAVALGRLASGARYQIDPAHKPFQSVEVFLRLAPRENLPYWLFHRLSGRSDELHIQARLRRAPAQELEVGRTDDRDYRGVVAIQGKEPFELVPAAGGWEIARRGRKDAALLQSLQAFVEARSAALIRLSLRKEAPHLVVRMQVRPALAEPSEALVEALVRLLADERGGEP